MGYTSSRNWTKKSDIINEIRRDYEKSGYTVIDDASTRQGYYLAVRSPEPDAKTYISCHIIEFRIADQTWWHKSMTETCGPRIVDCPLRLLDTPCTVSDSHGWASQWRESVKRYHESRNKNKGVNLIGKRVMLYGKYDMRIIGKSEIGRGYSARGTVDRVKYRIKSSQVKDLVLVDETRLQVLCELHYQQGGTIHQFNELYQCDINALTDAEFTKLIEGKLR